MMDKECSTKTLILYQNYPSKWDGVDWLSISFVEHNFDFSGFSAVFSIGPFTFTNNNLSTDWIINLSSEQTKLLPLGINAASLIVYDENGAGKPFTTALPILVKNWVEGDIDIDTYNVSVKAILNNETQFTINVNSPSQSLNGLKEVSGYDETKTQVLKNINGIFTWIDE